MYSYETYLPDLPADSLHCQSLSIANTHVQKNLLADLKGLRERQHLSVLRKVLLIFALLDIDFNIVLYDKTKL